MYVRCVGCTVLCKFLNNLDGDIGDPSFNCRRMERIFHDDGFAATSSSGSHNAWLIFFVDGGGEAAREITAALESYSSTLQETRIVVLSTSSHSGLHQQFEAIYGPTPVNTVTFIANGGAAVIRWDGHGDIKDLIQKVLLIASNPDADCGEFGYPSQNSLRDFMLGNSNDDEVVLANGSATPFKRVENEMQLTGSSGKKISSQGQPKEVTVLQIRSPDGSSVTKTFKTSSMLSEVREMIAAHFSLSDGFGLATSFPRYHYVSGDYDRNLEELDLWPNAVLLIVPADPRPVNRNVSLWNYTANISSWAYTLIMHMWNRISSYFSFTDNSSSHPETHSSERQTNAQPGPSLPRRRGNIHTLRDTGKDDDKRRRTYNGNSTQQL